jgi:hypothetical protein
MIEPDPERRVRDLFASLAHALRAGDLQGFRSLVTGPDPYEEEIFLELSLSAREAGGALALRDLQLGSDEARFVLEIQSPRGQVVRTHPVTLVQLPQGWAVEEL